MSSSEDALAPGFEPHGDETVGYDLGPDASSDGFPRPSNIGRYVVLDILGVGGMGVVCTAYDPKLDRKVAIKLLRDGAPHPTENTSMTAGQARLFREAQALAKLAHPNVITVHDVDTFEGQLYIAMEYVEGQSLKEWFREGKRGWRDVLRVFVDAGRGLAAAHAADITHRDFKPANVLLGNDGRVRVLDFGLAKKSDDEATASLSPRVETGEVTPTTDDAGLLAMMQSANDLTLTQAGRSVGTPAYMAPEQHLGLDVGPWTDQFSFCVSLWEGLYGELPFTGNNADEQFRNVVEGRTREPPKSSGVPAWLHRVVVRGLDPQTRNRFPDMNALLAALDRDPARARRRWATVAAAAVLAGGGAFGLAEARDQKSQLCAAGHERAATIWNDERRDAVSEAFAATRLSFAADTFDRVATQMDEYRSNWAGTYATVCEATHVSGEQSSAMLDVRMGCLQERRAAFSTLADAFVTADARMVEKAVSAVYALPDPAECATFKPEAGGELPDDPVQRERVLALGEQVSEAAALGSAGRVKEALERSRSAVEKARVLAHDATTARAELELASALKNAGELDEAQDHWRQAIRLAARTGQSLLEARGWVAVLFGNRLDKDAESLIFPAEAAVERAGSPGALRAHLLSSSAAILAEGGDFDGARARYEEALALAKETGDPVRLARELGNYGQFLAREGRYVEAREAVERALELDQKRLGPGHPTVADDHNNLGNIGIKIDDDELAREHHEEALRIRREILGEDHPKVGNSLLALGVVYKKQKDWARAEEMYREAEAIFSGKYGEEHPHLIAIHNNLAALLRAADEPERALKEAEEALRQARSVLKPESPRVANTLRTLCEVQLDLKQTAEALAACKEAEDIRRKVHKGEPSGALADTLRTKAEVLLAQGSRLAAVHALEEALSVHTALGEDSDDHSAVQLQLAQVMFGLADRREEALALARQAKAGYEAAGKSDKAGSVAQWLADPRPVPK